MEPREEFAKDETVSAWLRHYSPEAAQVNLSILYNYFRWLHGLGVKASPSQLIDRQFRNLYSTDPTDRRKKMEHTHLLERYVDPKGPLRHLQNATRRNIAGAVKSWYEANGCALAGKVVVPSDPAKGKRKTRAIGLDEFYTVYRALPLNYQVATLFIIYSGLRNGEETALTFGDVEEQLRSGRDPIRIELLNKKGMRNRSYIPTYWVYVGGHALRKLKKYLDTRGALPKSAPLFTNEFGLPLKRHNLQRVLKRTAVRLGLVDPNTEKGRSWRQPFHPHNLRRLFATEMDMAGVDKDWAEFLMGHAGGIHAVYSRRDELHPQKCEEEYLKIMEALDRFFTGRERGQNGD